MFSTAEKQSYAPFEILDPVFDAPGLSDAQRARAAVAVGYSMAIAAQGHGGPTNSFYEGLASSERASVASKWLQAKLSVIKVGPEVSTQVLTSFENFCAKALASYQARG